MAGLDRVKGPHWSQILAMFGPGGTISEALKDRNQVQLKDKARNLKLFFLKSGIEVPYYLKFVTGELKTRAPSQAAKNEAREREKKRGEEDKAHVEGIEGMMALAGAGQQQQQQMASGQQQMTSGPGPSPNSMSASPGLPQNSNNQAMNNQAMNNHAMNSQAMNQAMLDQTAEQNLMQTLGKEVHGENFQQAQQHPNTVNQAMPMSGQ